MAVVPCGRASATAAYRPLRTVHSDARVAASVVISAGPTSGSAAVTASVVRSRSVSSSVVGACCSTSRAAWLATSRLRIIAGELRSARATRSDWASISSTVASPLSTRAGSAVIAADRESKTSSPVLTCGYTGTVRRVASAMNPRVPSEPIIRWARMSVAESKSVKEFRP